MRAVTCTGGKFEVIDLPVPTPAKGQLLLEVLRCGICGSDLHARNHCDELSDITAEVGYDGIFRSDQSVVLGHEFCGEVLDHGPRTRTGLKPGTRVVSFPLLRHGGGIHTTGLSVAAPGGYAEQVLVEDSLTFAVPNGLSTDIATLTEPMAVGLHAVRRSDISKGQVAVVIGCGPVGLAVVGMLKASGVRTVIASDFSPGRRALATAVGADVVVDPAVESPFASAGEHGHLTDAPSVFELAVGTMEKLRALPLVPWHRVWQAADLVGAATPKHPVILECVGVPGVIDQLIASAPLFSRVVVVGVCMETDRLRPAMAVNKEIDLRFVLGYTPREFRDSLHLLADGRVEAAPVVTGSVGLAGIDAAFTALGDPETHAKILIDPAGDATTPVPVVH
ncbi:MAG TPA: zinc-binding dehydrogenase [Jatrophihabitans sp.]|uniref:zinc-binding dehydrogenase n=1 Tax=Jatrophihabitans sp. TaxID=1932789 RepID=UPI002DFE9462|nr:zinc-binding dehydrogenase [Jatrophihabitans sp.]